MDPASPLTRQLVIGFSLDIAIASAEEETAPGASEYTFLGVGQNGLSPGLGAWGTQDAATDSYWCRLGVLGLNRVVVPLAAHTGI